MARAIEQTPLLDEHGEPAAEDAAEAMETPAAVEKAATRRAWRSHLCTTALVLASVFLGALLGVALLAGSYAATTRRNIDSALSSPDGDAFWKEAVPVRGPDAINVVSVNRTKDASGALHLQINVSVDMRMTVDTDFAMGFREKSYEQDGWWTRKWKDIGRWGVRLLGSTTAVLDKVVVYSTSPSESDARLFTIKPLSPIQITLSPGLSRETVLPSLSPVSIQFLVEPSQNASHLLDFAEKSWAHASASVRLKGSDLRVHGGREIASPSKWWGLGDWRNWLKLEMSDVMLQLNLPIPPLRLPSHPPKKPGSGLPDLSELLTLESFLIKSAPSPAIPQSPQRTQLINTYSVLEKVLVKGEKSELSTRLVQGWSIIISARASLALPFAIPRLNLHSLTIPFTIYLPADPPEDSSIYLSPPHPPTHERRNSMDYIPVVQVYASPTFNDTHLQISMNGSVLPLTDSSPHVADAISLFVSTYLSYNPASIAISSPLYPALVVPATFPPPPKRLKLLRDVSLENMKIRPGFISYTDTVPRSFDFSATGMAILASATVHARVVLPPGVDIRIDVKRLWVDIFVFDGEVPENSTFLLGTSMRRTADTESAPLSTLDDPPVPVPRPLPDPLPERAFARITPRDWLNASSSDSPPEVHVITSHGNDNDDGDENRTNVFVTAQIVDVPLEVLPGRGDELSRFVSKVIFSSEPAVAGIQGVVAVGIGVPGLTSQAGGRELVLSGLPFVGKVKVGGHKFGAAV